jgi:hypothetical protein
MYEEVRATGLEYKADSGAYARVSGAPDGYRVKRYVVREPARDRYLPHVARERHEAGEERFYRETLIDERPLAWRYMTQ